jgi:putative selenate reductase molybdopterin-binding subunit
VAEVGSVERGFAEAERVFEATYRVPYVQQSSIEPHITITWLDEDHRLMVRTSTQVPFHVRRIIAPSSASPSAASVSSSRASAAGSGASRRS